MNAIPAATSCLAFAACLLIGNVTDKQIFILGALAMLPAMVFAFYRYQKGKIYNEDGELQIDGKQILKEFGLVWQGVLTPIFCLLVISTNYADPGTILFVSVAYALSLVTIFFTRTLFQTIEMVPIMFLFAVYLMPDSTARPSFWVETSRTVYSCENPFCLVVPPTACFRSYCLMSNGTVPYISSPERNRDFVERKDYQKGKAGCEWNECGYSGESQTGSQKIKENSVAIWCDGTVLRLRGNVLVGDCKKADVEQKKAKKIQTRGDDNLGGYICALASVVLYGAFYFLPKLCFATMKITKKVEAEKGGLGAKKVGTKKRGVGEKKNNKKTKATGQNEISLQSIGGKSARTEESESV